MAEAKRKLGAANNKKSVGENPRQPVTSSESSCYNRFKYVNPLGIRKKTVPSGNTPEGTASMNPIHIGRLYWVMNPPSTATTWPVV